MVVKTSSLHVMSMLVPLLFPEHVVTADAGLGISTIAAGIAGARKLTLLNSAVRTIDLVTLLLPCWR
jgi:hypothetical protein